VNNYKKQGQLQQKYRQLEEEVELRKLVDRAKGKLMTTAGIPEAEAYRWLQKTSMDTQSSLKKVANDVLKGRIEFK
jgi:two-component system, response regulator PdtaR